MSARSFSAIEREEWFKGIFDIYERMRARALGGPYEAECCDIRVTVFPNVFAPDMFTDSCWFSQQLPRLVGRTSLLEIGTGTGFIAIACARAGATVVATDANPYAVENARANVRAHRLDRSIAVREGDVYEAVSHSELFEHIFWAHPFNNWPEPVNDWLLRSGMDHNYSGLRKYIADARSHLAPNGRLLLGTGDTADLVSVSSIAAEHDYDMVPLDSARMPLEHDGQLQIEYRIYELVAR